MTIQRLLHRAALGIQIRHHFTASSSQQKSHRLKLNGDGLSMMRFKYFTTDSHSITERHTLQELQCTVLLGCNTCIPMVSTSDLATSYFLFLASAFARFLSSLLALISVNMVFLVVLTGDAVRRRDLCSTFKRICRYIATMDTRCVWHMLLATSHCYHQYETDRPPLTISRMHTHAHTHVCEAVRCIGNANRWHTYCTM